MNELLAPPDRVIQIKQAEFERYKDGTVKKCVKCNGMGWLDPNAMKMCECMADALCHLRLMCSNIPPTYQKVTFDQFVRQSDPGFNKVKLYSQKLAAMQENGYGLHIYNPNPGAGKTMLATCVLLEAIKAGHWVWFTSMAELLEDIRRGYDDRDIRQEIEWAMYHSSFLLLDELSKFHAPPSGWVEDRLNDLIQRRVNAKLPIISTDNVDLEQLADKYQSHIVSRFMGRQLPVLVDPKVDFRTSVLKLEAMETLLNS